MAPLTTSQLRLGFQETIPVPRLSPLSSQQVTCSSDPAPKSMSADDVPSSTCVIGKERSRSVQTQPAMMISVFTRHLQGCSLVGLLDALQEIFSREPPVYAKPKEAGPAHAPSPQPPASIASDYSHRPPPPIPSDRPTSVEAPVQSTPSAVDVNLGGPPPLPAKPGVPAAFSPLSGSPAPLPQTSVNDRSRSPATFNSVRIYSTVLCTTVRLSITLLITDATIR